eukprot:403352489
MENIENFIGSSYHQPLYNQGGQLIDYSHQFHDFRLTLDHYNQAPFHNPKDENVQLTEYLDIVARREFANLLVQRDNADENDDTQASLQIEEGEAKKSELDKQVNWGKVFYYYRQSIDELVFLQHLTECLTNKKDVQFQKKMIEYTINQDTVSRQQAVDYAQQIITLDSCIDRVQSQINLIQQQQALDRQEYEFLQFLRRLYLLIDIRHDPYLSKAFAKQASAQGTSQKHYVIVLNHKSIVKPDSKSANEDLENHYLTKDFQLMKRVIVQVQQTSVKQFQYLQQQQKDQNQNNDQAQLIKKAQGGIVQNICPIKLQFHPKIKQKPLLYVEMQLNLKLLQPNQQPQEVMNQDQNNLNNQSEMSDLISELYGSSRVTYRFDLGSQVTGSDMDNYLAQKFQLNNKLQAQELHKQLKKGVRSLMLYDVIFKIIQENDLYSEKSKININQQDQYQFETSLRIENLLEVEISLKFSDQRFEDPDPYLIENLETLYRSDKFQNLKEHHLSNKLMKQLFMNIAENTHSAYIMRNLYFIVVKKYLSSLISSVFYQHCGFKNIQINSKYNAYKDITWEVTYKKVKPVVQQQNKTQDLNQQNLQSHQQQHQQIDKIIQSLTSYQSPRVVIKLDQYYQLTVREDALEGLRGTDFDSEKLLFINNMMQQSRITHYEEIKRIARDLNNLSCNQFK